MNNCNEYIDMISAYADGELSESDLIKVEEHIGICGQCAALLDTYLEITAAINENAETAPEQLLTNVMSEISAVTYERKKKSPLIRYMPVYMPLAACIVAAFLVWGVYENNFANPFGNPAADNETREAGGGTMSSRIAEDSALPETSISTNSDTASDGGTGGEGVDTSAGTVIESAGIEDEKQPGSPGAAQAITQETMMMDHDIGNDNAAELTAESALGNSGEADSFNRSAAPLMPWDLVNSSNAGNYTEPEKLFIDNIKNAAQWITITGEMPEILAAYEPEPIDTQFGWEALYIIPDEDAASIITILADNEKNTAQSGNISYKSETNAPNMQSSYAVVLYTSKG